MLRTSQLIGFNSPRIINPIGNISFYSASVSSPSTPNLITAPADILPDDLIILFDDALNNISTVIPTEVIPPDMNKINGAGDVIGGVYGLRCAVSWKSGINSDSNKVFTGMNANASNKIMVVFRPTGGSRWNIVSSAADNDASTPTIGTINATGVPGIMICFGDNFVNPATSLIMNPVGTYGDNITSRGGFIIYNSSPSNNTPTGSTTGGCLMGVYITRLP